DHLETVVILPRVVHCFGAIYARVPPNRMNAGPGEQAGMVQSRELAARFEAYSDWRRRLSAGISGLHEWLSQQELADAQADLRIQHLLERLHQDTLVIQSVAESSRRK